MAKLKLENEIEINGNPVATIRSGVWFLTDEIFTMTLDDVGPPGGANGKAGILSDNLSNLNLNQIVSWNLSGGQLISVSGFGSALNGVFYSNVYLFEGNNVFDVFFDVATGNFRIRNRGGMIQGFTYTFDFSATTAQGTTAFGTFYLTLL